MIPETTLNLIFFLVSCLALFLSGTLLVKALVKISGFLKMSKFVTAFIIMAFSTSLPELFVGISSAIAKNPALALGTVIGSNIADIGLVGGIVLLVARKINIGQKTIIKDSTIMVLMTILPLVLMWIGKELSRIDGVILTAAFIFYLWKLVKEEKRFSGKAINNINRWIVLASALGFIASLILLFVSSRYVVFYGNLLAMDLLLPPIFVGLFFVALGTSLPELVFETRAIMMGYKDFALGDLMGSVVCNSTLVLGVTALIYPITAQLFLFFTSAIFMITLAVLFTAFVETGKLSWRTGIGLLMLYILFIIVELSLKGRFYGA